MHARRRSKQRGDRGLLVVVIAAAALVVGAGMLTCSLLDRRDRGGVLQTAALLRDGARPLLVTLDHYTADRRKWVSLTVIDVKRGQLLARRRVGVGGGVQLAGIGGGAIWLYVGKHLQAYELDSLEPRYVRRQLKKALQRKNGALKLASPPVMGRRGYARFWLHATGPDGRGLCFDPKTLQTRRASSDKLRRDPLPDDAKLLASQTVQAGSPPATRRLLGKLRRRLEGAPAKSPVFIEGAFALQRAADGGKRPIVFGPTKSELLVHHRASIQPDAPFRLSRVDKTGEARWTLRQADLPRDSGSVIAGVWALDEKTLLILTRGDRSRALREREHKNVFAAVDAKTGKLRWSVMF